MKEDTLIQFGGSIKALGDGRVGGLSVLFTDNSSTDIANDFFDATTDYAVAEWPAPCTVYYNHGNDATLGVKALGGGAMKGTMTLQDAGVWVEVQLNLADQYEAAIYSMAEKGKLGWSSGTAHHLMRRENSGNAKHVTYWPLGLDMSLTPTPCEPRARVMALKSWDEQLKPFKNELSLKGKYLGDDVESQMGIAAVCAANSALMYGGSYYDDSTSLIDIINDESLDAPAKIIAIGQACDEFKNVVLKMLTPVLTADDAEDQAESAVKFLQNYDAKFRVRGTLIEETLRSAKSLGDLVGRWKDRVVVRKSENKKSARVLSQANEDALTGVVSGLQKHATTIQEIIASNADPTDQDDPDPASMKSQQVLDEALLTLSRLNGISV
jgi:hypothetical protein